jgi:hypothetical protein
VCVACLAFLHSLSIEEDAGQRRSEEERRRHRLSSKDLGIEPLQEPEPRADVDRRGRISSHSNGSVNRTYRPLSRGSTRPDRDLERGWDDGDRYHRHYEDSEEDVIEIRVESDEKKGFRR